MRQCFINLQAHFSCFAHAFRWEEIQFLLLQLRILTFVFFLTCLNINKSIQYQGRCYLLGMSLTMKETLMGKHTIIGNIYTEITLWESRVFQTAALGRWWCYWQIRRGACFSFPSNAFLFWNCTLMFKPGAGNQFEFRFVFAVQRQTPLDGWAETLGYLQPLPFLLLRIPQQRVSSSAPVATRITPIATISPSFLFSLSVAVVVWVFFCRAGWLVFGFFLL